MVSNPLPICSLPTAITDLGIAGNGDDVILTWSGTANNYEIHRNTTDAYFSPDPTSLLAVTALTSYVDTSVDMTAENYYYVVRSCGTVSNRTGVFSFPFVASGAPPNTKYYAVAQVLDNGVVSASALINDVTATTSIAPGLALKWEPFLGYAFYNPSNPSGGGSVDYSIQAGDPVFLEAEADGGDTYTVFGNVPTQGSVSFALEGDPSVCKYNQISIPLDRSDLTVAAALTADIGDVDLVLEWDPILGYAFYNPSNPSGGGSVNFPVKPGFPYYVCMTNSKAWPTP